VLNQTCDEFLITQPSLDASSEDIATTRAFLKNRQMSALDGFLGMVHELSRGSVSSGNTITAYREHVPTAKDSAAGGVSPSGGVRRSSRIRSPRK